MTQLTNTWIEHPTRYAMHRRVAQRSLQYAHESYRSALAGIKNHKKDGTRGDEGDEGGDDRATHPGSTVSRRARGGDVPAVKPDLRGSVTRSTAASVLRFFGSSVLRFFGSSAHPTYTAPRRATRHADFLMDYR
ncbi:hypothetical protein [Pararobbsia silviterrae]|nr:hypothetical protein [Pararobbsia silviterrae]